MPRTDVDIMEDHPMRPRPPAPTAPAPPLASHPDRPDARPLADAAAFPARTSPRIDRPADADGATPRASWPAGR